MPAIAFRQGAALPFCVALLAFAATLASGNRLLVDPDCYLHVAIGKWIVEHGAVPRTDMFSYSVQGAPWVAHEWLAGIAFAEVHAHFGWSGLAVLTALCFAATLGLLAKTLLNCLPPLYVLSFVGLAAGLCFPHFFARPHILTWPLLVLWLSELVDARSEDRAPRAWMALLIVLWANIHASFVFALGIAALVGAEALLEATNRKHILRVTRGWGTFGLLSLAASLITPYGIDGWFLPLNLLRMNHVLSAIREWQSPNFQSPHPLEPALLLLVLGSLSAGIRLPITRVAMLLFLLHIALLHQRNSDLLGIAAPVLLAPSLAPQLRPVAIALRTPCRRVLSCTARAGLMASGVVFAFVLTGLMVRAGIVPDHGPTSTAPVAGLAFAHQRQLSGPVFNDINFGDFMIFSGDRPFIDGRVDMYGDEFFRSYADVASFSRLARQYGFTWAIISPRNAHLPLLDNLAEWHRTYADNVAVVFERDPEISR